MTIGPQQADAVSHADAALAAIGVTKRFPGVLANDRVDLEVRPGEVHALLGENGSGKTTLCKVLTGLYRPDAGKVIVAGEEVDFHSPADAFSAGVAMVHQHFSLVGRLSVAENIVLGRSTHRGLRFNRRAVEEEVRKAADTFGISVDPRAPVWQLSVGERQRVEILKALYRGARTLILDEPTTVLTPQEAQHLFSTLRTMADGGRSVVFISHKLDEVAAVCDRVTVLRQGRKTGTVDLREHDDGQSKIDARALSRMMVGREIRLTRREASASPSAEKPLLELSDVVVHNDFDRPVVQSVSLDVRSGEILGVAGVAGNGQRELAEAICGLRKLAGGQVAVEGRVLRSGSVRDAIARGIAFVPEDRMGVGLASGLTVAENLVLKAFRSDGLRKGPFMRHRRIRERASELVERFDIRGTTSAPVGKLSGGNAQKVVLAREMSSEPRVLVIAAPTRGLDVSAMEAVRRLLVEAASGGTSVVLFSEDLEEILDLADRVAVMTAGRIVGVLEAECAEVEEIGLLMMGQEVA